MVITRGICTINIVYHTQMDPIAEGKWWWWKIQTTNPPQKCQIFMWLVLTKKIVTWDNLWKRQLQGPDRCCLCHVVEGSVPHLFFWCPYFSQIWVDIEQGFHFHNHYPSANLQLNLSNWYSRHELKSFCSTPYLVLWGIWLARHATIFNIYKYLSFKLQK